MNCIWTVYVYGHYIEQCTRLTTKKKIPIMMMCKNTVK